MCMVSSGFRSFLNNTRGAVTTEYIAVASLTLVIGILISYEIMGDDDTGLAALNRGKQTELQAGVDNIAVVVAKANGFGQGDGGNNGGGNGAGNNGNGTGANGSNGGNNGNGGTNGNGAGNNGNGTGENGSN